MKKISKKDSKTVIEDFFFDLSNKSPSEIKKIIQLAGKERIKLGEKRKLFCKKCFSPHKTSKIRINQGIKSIECENCGYKNRWKIKPS
jgi:RNase P subunit RPR2